MTEHDELSRAMQRAGERIDAGEHLPNFDYGPQLGEPVVYRDSTDHEHAALITRVVDAQTVHLVVFPDQGHHHHVTASATAPDQKGIGWFPVDA